MLVGLLGAAVPIAVHLIGRRRARVVRFAAMDFLLGSNKRVARRLRLRELLLLAARILATVALALVLAKPYASCATEGPPVERGAQAAVLVIDNSLASTYELGGETLLAAAKREARQILADMGPEADVALVTTAEGSTAPEELERDHRLLRDRLDAIVSVPRPGRSSLALRRAAQLLETSNQAKKRVYLLSPLTAAEFEDDRAPWPEDGGPVLTVVDVAPGAELANLSVIGLKVEPDPDTGERGVRVTAELANYGVAAVDERRVSLSVAGTVVARGAVSLRPGETVEKAFSVPLPEASRISDVEFAVSDDPLALDNRRYVRAELREETRTLLVNGDPRTVRHEDELFYLETALRPGDRGDSGVSVSITNPDALGEVDLSDYDVIALVNVAALPEPEVARLAGWVDRGGGLLIAVGDRVNSDAYNASMRPLLPQELRDPVAVAYGASESEKRGRALRLSKLESDHPVFAVFPRDADGLREATFETVMLLGPTTNVTERRVLARYSNGAAALVEARSGLGRVFLFTSSLDRDWNDLSIHPGYLPLVQRSVRYLARKQSDRRDSSGILGRQHVLSVSEEVARVEIEGPGGRRTVLEGDRVEKRERVAFADTDEPGFYRVAIAAANRSAVDRPDKAFAINLDPRASDLRRAPPEILPASGSGKGTSDGKPPERRIELWHALAAALLGFLLLESLLLQR